jgi:hypothetical protein
MKGTIYMNKNIIKRIKVALSYYFEADKNGNLSPNYSEDYSAQDCIDDINRIVGGFKNDEII